MICKKTKLMMDKNVCLMRVAKAKKEGSGDCFNCTENLEPPPVQVPEPVEPDKRKRNKDGICQSCGQVRTILSGGKCQTCYRRYGKEERGTNKKVERFCKDCAAYKGFKCLISGERTGNYDFCAEFCEKEKEKEKDVETLGDCAKCAHSDCTASKKEGSPCKRFVSSEKLEAALDLVRQEYLRTIRIYPKMTSYHDGFGLLLEEGIELFDEIRAKDFKRNHKNTQKEAIHTANVALKIILLAGEKI